MERSVIGALTRRDSEFCPDTGSPMNSNAMEPGVTNPSLPMRLEPPSHLPPSHRTRPHARVVRSGHPYHPPAKTSRAPPVRQRSIPASSSNAESPDPLPAAIFRFLDRSEINIAMREDEPYLYIFMFSNCSLPFVVSDTHWTRLGNVEALYRIKTTTARHQCLPPNALRTLPT